MAGSSSTPSPACKRQLSPNAEQISLPKPKKSGSRLADEDQLAVHNCFAELVTTLHLHRHHVMPLYLHLQSRVRAEQAHAKATSVGGDIFERPIATMRSLPEEWLLTWLTSRCSLTAEQVVASKKEDPDSLYQLAQYELQAPAHLRFGDQLRVKEVCWRVLNQRAADCGSRLEKFSKADKPLLPSGQLNWAQGCYTLGFKGKDLISITHISGATVDCSGEKLTSEYKLEGNWSDMEAQLRRGKFPPIKLSLFFDEKSKVGPHSLVAVHNKSKAWGTLVAKIASEWAEERKKVQVGAADDQVAALELAKVRDQQKAQVLDKAREKAKSLLSARQQKRQIDLGEP